MVEHVDDILQVSPHGSRSHGRSQYPTVPCLQNVHVDVRFLLLQTGRHPLQALILAGPHVGHCQKVMGDLQHDVQHFEQGVCLALRSGCVAKKQ